MPSTASPRRTFLSGLIASVAALIFGQKPEAKAQETPTDWSFRGPALTTHIRKGDPPVQPLDTMLLFERGDDNNDRLMTHEVLSLIHEEKGKSSHPWTIYSSLATHHEAGDACVLCSRLHKYGPGWSTGLHSEVFNHNRAVALGVNIEMSSDYEGEESTQIIGLNILAVASNKPMQYGIQIHEGNGSFEKGIGIRGKGEVGLEVDGKYTRGIDVHDNEIWLNEGASIVMDGVGNIRLRYNNGQMEFMNGDRCVAHIDMNGEDHAV